MVISAKRDTKTAILDAAERMMATHGINGVSLRAILVEAGANSAALHYHFGSREGLIEAILARRGVENDLRRREILERLSGQAGPVSVDQIVDTIVDPLLELLIQEGESGRNFIRFLARLQTDRTGIHHEKEELYFPDVREQIQKMLAAACPDLSPMVLRWRITMVLDTMLQSLASAEFMSEDWTDGSPSDTVAEFGETLKEFLSAGLSAPVRRSSGGTATPQSASDRPTETVWKTKRPV